MVDQGASISLFQFREQVLQDYKACYAARLARTMVCMEEDDATVSCGNELGQVVLSHFLRKGDICVSQRQELALNIALSMARASREQEEGREGTYLAVIFVVLVVPSDSISRTMVIPCCKRLT